MLIKTKDVNDFILVVNEESSSYLPFVIIDSLEKKYDQGTSAFEGEGTFVPSLKNLNFKQAVDCIRDLKRYYRSELYPNLLVALTRESIERKWAWLIHANEDDVNAIRVEIASLRQTTLGLAVLKPSFDELQESAEKVDDGIIRM